MITGKIALVTGGSRGIGKAIVKALADAGVYVVFTYYSDAKQAAFTSTEISYSGDQCAFLQMDVRNRLWVRATMNAIKHSVGSIDILVNNAGVNMPTDFDKVTDADWHTVLDINLMGPFVVMQEAIPHMNSGGAIINIGSVSGQYGGPRTAHYAASKAGLVSLTQVVARFRPDLRCNVVSPGLIVSSMAEKGMESESMERIKDNIIQGRLGTAEEVAQAVLFLASAEYITGQTINVNGGLYF